MEGVVPVVEMLACFDSVRVLCILSVVVVQSFVIFGFRLLTYCILQSRHSNSKRQSYFYKKLCDIHQFFSFVCVLSNVVVDIICRHERHCDVLHGTHSPLVIFFLISCLIVFLPIICLDWCCFEHISECIVHIIYMPVLINHFSHIWQSWAIC